MEMEFYRNLPLFKEMGAPELRDVLAHLQVEKRHYLKGETIFHQGECIHQIGLVVEGIVKGVNYDLMGHANVIARMERGDFFGESYALIGHVPMVVSIEVLKECEIHFFDVQAILALNNEKLNRHLINILATKNIYLTRKLNAITPKSIRDRLLSYLSDQQAIHGSDVFDIPFNRQELADYLLVDRSSLSHELSLMQQEGLIRFKKNHFVILKQGESD